MEIQSKERYGRKVSLMLRDIAVGLFFLVLAYKFFFGDWELNIKELTKPDILSILLAFFAIGLSIAFYFKATETANTFYDNTYKFTKEISEILGRIEAGFGEKLRHIDEGYFGLQQRFDTLSFDPVVAKQQIEKSKGEVEKRAEEFQETIDRLVEKVNVGAEEKEKIKAELEEKEQLLQNARFELELLRSEQNERNVNKMTRNSPARVAKPSEFGFVSEFILEAFSKEQIHELIEDPRADSIRLNFAKSWRLFPNRFKAELQQVGFVKSSGDLTVAGIHALQHAIKDIRKIYLK